MSGKNWISYKGEWSDLVHQDTKDKAASARKMKLNGMSAKEIANKLELSVSRIYQYLRD